MKLCNCDIGDGVHLVLLRDWDERDALLRTVCQSRVHFEWYTWFNDAHWRTIDIEFERLHGSGERVLVFTMNPYAIDKLSVHSADSARRHILFADENGLRNMSADDAERFYRAYEVGVQHVSEILRTEGLW